MSRSCLDRDSQSRHWQRAGLDSRENCDTFKKLVLTIEISRSRPRNLDFVSTSPSSPKSLDRDQEICRDMTFLANLNSLSRSRSRVSQFLSHFSIKISQFVKIFYPEVPPKVKIMSRYLDKSQKVSTNLENLDSLDLSQQSRQKSRHSQVSIEKSRF